MKEHLTPADLLRYDRWATDELFEAVSTLSPEQFTRELAGGLSSVRQQGVHIVSVDDRYRARIMGEPVPEVAIDAFHGPADLMSYTADVARRVEEMLPALTPARLAEEIRHETRRGTFVLTVEETVLHMVNHGTYHRGQIASLLKIHGVEPIDTDLVIWCKHRREG